MSKNSNSKKLHLIPKGVGLKLVAILLILAEAALVALLVMLDILPLSYFIAAVVVLLAIDFGVLLLLSSRRRGNKRIVGLICTVILLSVLLLGCWYLYNTHKVLEKVTDTTAEQYDMFHVVVAQDTTYEDISQIKGREVYTVKVVSKSYQEAQNMLQNKVEITYNQVDDTFTAGEKIYTGEGTAKDEIIFVSSSNYEMLCDEIEDYDKNTRILYTVKVKSKTNDTSSDIDVTEDSFNLYVSCADVWGDLADYNKCRSDVNMIMTVNPKTKQILLTSLSRDSYVTVHSVQQPDKLTHTSVYDDGINETLATVQDWLGIDMDFYLRANFGMIVDLVYAMDGIDVYSDFEFSSRLKNYHYKKGWNHLSGKGALYFARERKCFVDNDRQRVKNQQKVVKAIIAKASESKTILTSYTDILDAVSNHMQTSMSDKDLAALVKMQLKDMSGWEVNACTVEGTETQKGTYIMGLGRPLDVVIPDEDSVERAKELINKVMYPEDGKRVLIEEVNETNGLKETAPITYRDKNGNVIGHSNDEQTDGQ